MASNVIVILHRNERRLQAKYDEDESTLSEESSALQELKCKFQRLDVNRERRKSVLMRPIDINGPEDKADTIRRYVNLFTSFFSIEL